MAVVAPRLVGHGVEVFRAFALALKMPKGCYGDEEYAPNANAFLEYLDDVHEWVPAKGHVVVMRGAEQIWKVNARLAGLLGMEAVRSRVPKIRDPLGFRLVTT
jgi:hypothetical protein